MTIAAEAPNAASRAQINTSRLCLLNKTAVQDRSLDNKVRFGQGNRSHPVIGYQFKAIDFIDDRPISSFT